MSTGQITRKEIIEDEALRWGEDYAKLMEKAIEKNKEFVGSILALNEANKQVRGSGSQKELAENQRRANAEGERAVAIWKEQNQAELALISTKRRNQLATEGTSRALARERAILQETNAEIKRQAIANGALESSYKKLVAQMGIAGDRVKNIISTGKIATETQEQYNKRLQVARAEFDKLNGRVRAADAAVGQFNRNVGNYPQQAVQGLKSLISAFGVTTGIFLFAKVMKEAFSIVRDFEKQNATLSAVLQVEKGEMKELTDQAKKLGETTVKTAGEVTSLQIAYARLGFSQQQILDLTEATIAGSIAMNSNLAETADLVGAVVNSFDSFDSTSGPEIIDIMSLATAKSALNFEKLQTAIPISAGAANAAGIPFTRLVALFGKLADAGIDASSSSTALRNIFIESASQGLNYEQIIEKIKNSTDKLTASNDEFGKRGAVSASIIAENIDKVNDLDVALQGAAGTAENMADKELATLDGAVKLLNSAWEGLIINTANANDVNGRLASGLTFLANNLKTIFNVLAGLAAVWLAYRTSLIIANVQTKLIALNTQLAANAQARNAIATGAATQAQLANAGATNLAALSWQKFNTALKANALFLILSALIAAVYYLDKFNKSLAETTKETTTSTDAFLKNREAISKNNQSIATLSDRYDVLKKKSELTKEEQKELDEILKILAKTVPGAVTEVDKYGDALAINTTKTREFIVAQEELRKLQETKLLKENIDLNKKLAKEKKTLTISEDDLNAKYVEGIGYIQNRNGKLEVYNKILGTSRDLTIDEQIAFKKKVLDNEKNIAITEKNIDLLSGKTKAEKEAAKASEEASKTQQVNAVRTISIIDAEIKAQEDLIATLSDKTGKQGNAIKSKITALKAERELIFSTEKAEKSKFENGLKGYKKVTDAIFNLSQFRLQNEIKNNQKILDSDTETLENKINALKEINQLQDSKNRETLEFELRNNLLSKEDLDKLTNAKLELYKKDVESRITALIQGKIAQENITNEEKLILEKYYAEKKNLQEQDSKRTQEVIDNQFKQLQKGINQNLLTDETELNKQLTAQNNLYKANLDIIKDFYKQKELLDGLNIADYDAMQAEIKQLTFDNEAEMFAIKKEFATKGLNMQISAIEQLLLAQDALPENERISAEKRAEIENELSKSKLKLSEVNLEQYEEDAEKRIQIELLAAEKIRELSQDLYLALQDFVNVIFDAKIQKIDEDIAKNDEYYARQIELAGNDQVQKDLLTEEAEKKRKKLEAEKRKEQRKQAIFNKVTAIAEIGINTAAGIMATIKNLGLPFATPFVIATGLLGALQVATVLATPIPKYEKGTKNHKGGFAEVGEVRPEVVIEPGKKPYIVSKPSILNLKKGTEVVPSVPEYEAIMRASYMASLNLEGKKTTEFQASNAFEKAYGKEIVDELKRNTDAVRNSKQRIVINSPKIDINHHLWKKGNTSWN